MSDPKSDKDDSERGFLARWSRRKADATRAPVAPAQAAVIQAKDAPEPGQRPHPDDAVEHQGDARREGRDIAKTSTGAPSEAKMPQSPRQSLGLPTRVSPLPDLATLTKDSDFAPFMAQDVAAETRNAALKTLFADPHFKVMDGLDTYIDDYSVSQPLSPLMLEKLERTRQRLAEAANAMSPPTSSSVAETGATSAETTAAAPDPLPPPK